MAKNERLRRDIAGVGPEPRRIGLSPLRSLKDFKIAKGEPDIRGWSVRTLNGNEVGKVDDLLVDQEAGEVVMMDVEMRASEQHVQLPIRTAQLDLHAHRVIVDSGDVTRYASMNDVPRNDDRSLDRYFDEDHARERGERVHTDEESMRGREREAERERMELERVEHERISREREARELEAEEAARRTRAHHQDASSVERQQLAPDMRSDADEVVIERRPVIEEVVIRRRVVDDK